MRKIFIAALVLSLAACGFHLRGHNANINSFPFSNLYLKSNSASPFISDLRNSLELYKIKLTETAAEADLTLEIVSEASNKQIIALSGSAQVREFQLSYVVSLRAYDKQKQDWMPADEISLHRNMTYDDAQILAKEQEEALNTRDMRSDAVQQVMRRLSRAKLRVKPEDKSVPVNTPAAVKK